jgi:DNA repair exonuclease SbcCD ATPase subunit
VWEIDSHHVDFVDVENDTAFYTVNVDAGIHPPIDETLPANLYLRVRYKNTDQSALRTIVEDVRKQRNLVEVATQRTTTFTDSERSAHAAKGVDFRSVEQQKDLITKYLKRKHDAKEEDIARVLEINEEVNKSLKKSEIPRNSMWIPKRFEFDDMFSYGKGNSVDFSEMQGVYGMFAPNASGKSTLLDSITFCLFDKCAKTTRGHQVMNATSDTFKCKLNFELNGLDYYIERRARRQSSGNVRVEVDFYYVDERGEKVSLNGKDRSDTNASIRNLLGTYEDFVLTTLSTQSNHTGFIDMNQKDRKDLLSQFMDIGVFEELHSIASEASKETAAVLKHYQKTDYESKLTEYQASLKEAKKTLKTENDAKSVLEKEQTKLNDRLVELATKLQSVDDSIIDEAQLTSAMSAAKKRKQDLENQSKPLVDAQHALAIEIDELNFILDNVDEEDLKKSVQECSTLKNEYFVLELQINDLKSRMSHKEDKMGKLKELEYDPDCKYCMNNVFVKDAIAVKQEVELDREKLHKLQHESAECRKKLKECKDVEETKEHIEDQQKLLAKKNKESNENSAKLDKINKRVAEEDSIISLCENKLEQRAKQISTIQANQVINQNISATKSELAKLETNLKSVNMVTSNLNAQIKILEKDIEETKKQIDNRKDLENSYHYYQYYLDATHRDGIPHDIISVTIPQIEEEVNNILSQLVDFKILFETDDKNVNAYIAYSEEKFWPLELTSGMEKFVSSLAIRTSLINISTLPRPNFLAVDEGFGTLDKGNLGSMSMLFEYLKTQFKFLMVISHIDSMRDIVDDHIEIHKVNGKSSVNFG